MFLRRLSLLVSLALRLGYSSSSCVLREPLMALEQDTTSVLGTKQSDPMLY